jgi:sugar fermentation stimulation protein A
MLFHNLITGTFVKRYKRFFVDILHKNKKITAHCPNSGSMLGLLNKDNNVWFSISDNKKRKLKYTLEIMEQEKNLVGVNTHLTNKIVKEALLEKKISELSNVSSIKPEAVFDKNTRFDFLLENYNKKIFLEVKNVTLSRNKNLAEFPDAKTERGKKHLLKLVEAQKKGFDSYMIYLVQRNDCKNFKIAHDIDPEYKKAYDYAKKNKVKMLCYDCQINSQEVKLNKRIL